MLSAARLTANRANAQHSTGPRTLEGKAASSRNATTLGLFTTAIVVHPDDQPEFDALAANLEAEYSPATETERTFAQEALRASWRIRRCDRLEAALTAQSIERGLPDPLENPETAPKLTSIDRARAQAATALRRTLKELRQIQTERQLRAELQIEPTAAGHASYKEIVCAVAKETNRRRSAAQQPSLKEFQDLLDKSNPLAISRLTKQTQPPVPSYPRNALCPCGSGVKFKRCCIARAAA